MREGPYVKLEMPPVLVCARCLLYGGNRALGTVMSTQGPAVTVISGDAVCQVHLQEALEARHRCEAREAVKRDA
jgi:hypothetical protein